MQSVDTRLHEEILQCIVVAFTQLVYYIFV